MLKNAIEDTDFREHRIFILYSNMDGLLLLHDSWFTTLFEGVMERLKIGGDQDKSIWTRSRKKKYIRKLRVTPKKL